MEHIVTDIDRHYAQEGAARKQLHTLAQTMETQTLIRHHKRAQCESARDQPQDSQTLQLPEQPPLQEMASNRDTLTTQLRGFQGQQEQLLENIRQKPNLAERWVALAKTHAAHEEELVEQIPTEGEVVGKKAETIVDFNNMLILKLKEQIKLRDQVLARAHEQLREVQADPEPPDPRLVRHDDLLTLPQEHTPMIGLRSPTISMGKLRDGSVKLVPKAARLKPSRKPSETSPQAAAAASRSNRASQRKEKKDEKRSHSVFSNNTSFSTGASTGAPLPTHGGSINNIARQIQQIESRLARKDEPYIEANRKLKNAGALIVGGYRKFRSERPHYAPLTDLKPSILSRPDKAIFQYLSKNKPEP